MDDVLTIFCAGLTRRDEPSHPQCLIAEWPKPLLRAALVDPQNVSALWALNRVQLLVEERRRTPADGPLAVGPLRVGNFRSQPATVAEWHELRERTPHTESEALEAFHAEQALRARVYMPCPVCHYVVRRTWEEITPGLRDWLRDGVSYQPLRALARL